MIEPIWDDERLRRAYRDRFGRAAPAGFAAAVAEASRRRGRSPSRLPAFVALTATLAIAIGLGAAALAPRPRDDDPERRLAHGLPILTVTEAIAVRSATNEPQEIAVAGFLSLPDPGIRCAGLQAGSSINPVRLECPDTFGWLLESSRPLDAIRSSLPANRVGFQPLFPGLDTAELRAVEGPELPEVVLIGHFHDRRSRGALCDAVEIGACDGFVATAIASIGGKTVAASTVIDLEPVAPEPRREPVWTPDDVDRLILAPAPDLDVLSRVALPGHRIGELEPALGTGILGVIDRPIAWLVNGLQPDPSGLPRLRTFLLVDGAPDEAYEADSASRIGFTPIDLAGPAISPPPSPPSGDLTFPAEVHGLRVISVTEALAELDKGVGILDSTALAVRGFYVVPPDSVACIRPRPVEPLPLVDRRCPEGLVWLMDEPERPWDLVDGVARWHRPIRPALHPIVRAEVPFDLPRLFRDTIDPDPLPVVVLGHFGDVRAKTEREAREFVVDTLAWRLGEPSGDETVILGQPPVEQRAAVEARVEEALGPARATWAAVIRGAVLIGLNSAMDPELLAADSVWQLARLVDEGGRLVVRHAYTIDDGERIWTSEGLAPERRIEVVGGRGGKVIVDVVDGPDIMVGAREVATEEPDPAAPRVFTEGVLVPIALSNPTGRPRELRFRWTATDCDERWTIWLGEGGRTIDILPVRRPGCQAVPVDIDILLTFSEPVSADDVQIGGSGVGG